MMTKEIHLFVSLSCLFLPATMACTSGNQENSQQLLNQSCVVCFYLDDIPYYQPPDFACNGDPNFVESPGAFGFNWGGAAGDQVIAAYCSVDHQYTVTDYPVIAIGGCPDPQTSGWMYFDPCTGSSSS